MSDLPNATPAELIMLLRSAYEADRGRSDQQISRTTRVELARLLDADENFKAAVIAVLQIWLTGEDLVDGDDLSHD
ncbi:hypothetical protein [Deinococcus ruber]|uniref:Uncharacterized protein n=1 Tax=Deinococcus ruber TaxID=1848197 RepID=A0A918FFQ8_9DEIO|nr:hypothetical protein [Deinococcus ruber]GGR35166.1 hypothetical protein GCM10008957_51390 [Deinococcus ruber]